MKRNHQGETVSCDDTNEPAIVDAKTPAKNLIRSKYADIMIKVDEDIYHLDRLQLACKSDYFEKSFTEDFREKTNNVLQLPVLDSDTFSTIVDIIYGQELKSILDADNYVLLLIAMDYLQMKVDQKVYGEFIENFVQKKPSLDLNLFSLCEYLAENKNYNVLMPFVYTCMSTHLDEVRDRKEFLSLPLDHVVGIISGQRLDFSNVNDIRQCSRVCVKWIFHDVENRLPHAIKLVNAVKSRFSFPYRIKIEDLKVKIREAGEEVTPDTVLRYFNKMVVNQGEIGSSNAVMLKTLKPRERNYDKKDADPVDPNERDKLTRFLENGDFSDVEFRFEEKTYKLHRCKLLSESGYFADVFSSEISETSRQSGEDNEYSLNVEGVDQSSIDVSIKYIYHQKLDLNFDTIVGVLKTACALKIVRLVGDCESWIIKNLREMSFEVVFEILNFICIGDLIGRFEHMYKCLLSQRILTAWSAVEDFSSFCAISIDMLEDLLITPELPVKADHSSLPENFSFDDPNKLLDICSKWVMGDVENRYHFIPRIALAINCHVEVNDNDYKKENMPDLSNCSEQLIRVQLLKLLFSNPLISRHTVSENTPREIKNEPAFITSSRTIISILNAEMDEIASLWLFNGEELTEDESFRDFASATKMGDYLFITADVYGNYRRRIFFQAYNILSKKFTSLAYLPNEKTNPNDKLLNCRGDIYACSYGGHMLKYMMHLNRWTTFTNMEADDYTSQIASDGETLYRVYETKISNEDSPYVPTDKIFQTYDFDRNLWIPVPEMTIRGNVMPGNVIDFINMNNGDIGVCFSSTFWIFNRNLRIWRQIPLPINCDNHVNTVTFIQWGNTLFLSNWQKMYSYQLSKSNQSWHMKERVFYHPDSVDQYFGCLNGIHRSSNRINSDPL